MAPSESNVDYYAVLEISNIATIDVVTKSYRRLAKIGILTKTRTSTQQLCSSL